MKKLDRIIIVVKNWLNDSCLNCTPNVHVKVYEANAILAKENYQLINKVEYFEELQVDRDYVIQ